jgi:DNA-binding response OmpR family regulator
MLTGEVILIVEDQWIIADAIGDQLAREGAVVRLAATAAEAMRLAEDPELTLAVLDIELTGSNCDPVCELLEQHGVPFLFCTAYGHHPVIERWKAPVIKKPASLRAILQALVKLRGDETT